MLAQAWRPLLPHSRFPGKKNTYGKLGCAIYFDNSQKQKILIVDDSEMNRSILADMLGDEYDIIEVADGAEAIAVLQKHALDISLVLLDIVMPRVDGFEVLTVMNQMHWIENVPVIMISAESDASRVKRAYELGVTDFIARPFDVLIVRRRVINTLLLYAKQRKLIRSLADQLYETERHSSMMVDILSHIVEFRNGESGIHITRVRALTDILLRQLREKTDRYPLTPMDISLISTASALHDIGKIAINEAVLNKPGRLTAEEFALIQVHPLVGAEMLKNLPAFEEEPLIKYACEICRWHHERYDGRGYPDGLVGDQIPISAQIVALADVYDALTSDRCYKKAYSHATAIQMIADGECGAFNPLLLECLREVSPSLPEKLAAALNRVKRPELRLLTRDVIAGQGCGVSQRSLQLLDYERIKHNFYAEMAEEAQFEYTVTPSMLTLSAWGAKRLNVDEVTMDPQHSDKVIRLLGPDTWQELSRELRAAVPEHPVITYECQFHFPDQSRWYRITARAMWSPSDPPVYMGVIGKCVDIHDSRLRLEALEREASHDALTGLLNRANARKLIDAMITQNPEGNYLLAILDVDQFKSANDTFGHMFGDAVLKLVADKLRQNARHGEIIARVGGDEFLIFLEYKVDAKQVIDRIFSGIAQQYHGFSLRVSMGIACSNMVGNEYEKMFHAADQALYSVKRAASGHYQFYDESMRETLSTISLINSEEKGDNQQ